MVSMSPDWGMVYRKAIIPVEATTVWGEALDTVASPKKVADAPQSGVRLGFGVFVTVKVIVAVRVLVGVEVGVELGVLVKMVPVAVGENEMVAVGLRVGVFEAVSVKEEVGVAVGTSQ